MVLNISQGKMDDPETCKIYGYLISTLNSSYPDYDFRYEMNNYITPSSIKPDQFRCVESVPQAINDINHHLSEVHEISVRSRMNDIVVIRLYHRIVD